ncbi:MAG: MotA/TolQ/ExbB proton channel family protein [Opitutia bacterium]
MKTHLRTLLAPLAVATLAAALGAQEAAPAAAAAAAAPAVHKKTLMDLFHEGGWVMYPIAIASVAMIWFIVQGFINTSRKRLLPVDHVTQLRELFKAGNYVGAYAFAKSNASPVCDVVRAGVALAPDGKNMTEESIVSEITRVQGDLMGSASYLSVIGVCTPMIGLTGTVTGMMSAFETLSSSGVGDPSKLSGAIGEVLVATASGLFIAIPAFIAYYLLRNRISNGIHDVQEVVAGLFRGFPYDDVSGRKIGDEEIYAGKPDWNAAASQPQA